MVGFWDFLHLSSLDLHLIVNVFLADPLVLDVLEQPKYLFILGLDSIRKHRNLSPVEIDLLVYLLLDRGQFFLAEVHPLLFYLFLDGLHPAHKILPEFVLDLDWL